jgi:hypothetical protein
MDMENKEGFNSSPVSSRFPASATLLSGLVPSSLRNLERQF